MDGESVSKTLEFDINYTYAVLMKLTTIINLHESVNREALRGRNSFFLLLLLLLNLIASLVKLLYKLDDIWGSIP